MKNVILLATLILFIFTRCDGNRNEMQEYVLDDPISAILDSFVLSNPGQAVYELYIDKVGPEEGNLFLYAGEKSVTAEENLKNDQLPLMKIYSHNIPVQIYSGVERYLRNKKRVVKNSDTFIPTNSGNGVLWIVVDKMDSLTVIKNNDDLYPFFRLPITFYPKLNPPVIIPEKESGEKD